MAFELQLNQEAATAFKIQKNPIVSLESLWHDAPSIKYVLKVTAELADPGPDAEPEELKIGARTK